jgi:hypothetical protein
MLKTILLGSALALTPVLAFADQSTDQPSPYGVKTPGNGPTVYRHHWRADRDLNGGMIEQRSAAEGPMVGEPGFFFGAPATYRGYDAGVWTGLPNSPYATMFAPAAQ